MNERKADIKAADSQSEDRGERISLMEPLLIRKDSRHRNQLMEGLVQPSRPRERLFLWAEREIQAGTLSPNADSVLEAILYRGEIHRGEIPGLLGVSERQARRITSSLLNHEIVTSDSNRAPLRLSFPARLAPHLMPVFFPIIDRNDSKSFTKIAHPLRLPA